ncbi:hypothetical protein GWI33_000019 [Rhynchophorus ferrugineus]|uniref:Uncharacterized protein n=1 Tax=Rhynchophorus ferrugineus TaxID=354439 RepID=A0A834MM89_RHYFE|nr:hypothetical protein GWI33_000019 [Rhynchophorus ferrugineus]
MLSLDVVKRLKEISTECVPHIIHEYLGMRKLCAKWMLRELTVDQKQPRVDDSEEGLMIKRDKPEFLRRYVTIETNMMETYIHYFTLKSNRQSFQWTAHDETAPNAWKNATVGWQDNAVCILRCAWNNFH